MVGVEILWWLVDELLLSLELLCCVSDCEEVLLLFGSLVGELCAVRYKLPDEGRFRIDGSEKLAMALEVLSRANAANENSPPRFCLDETGECVDWRVLLKVLSRFEVLRSAAGAGEDVTGSAIE
jgi:hypothetical protein